MLMVTTLVALRRHCQRRRRRRLLLLMVVAMLLPQAPRRLLHRRLTRLATWLLPLEISHCLRSVQRRSKLHL